MPANWTETSGQGWHADSPGLHEIDFLCSSIAPLYFYIRHLFILYHEEYIFLCTGSEQKPYFTWKHTQET